MITVDDILVSHTALADLDNMLSHFEVRSKFAAAMGFELSKVFDKNVFRQIILSARATADGPFPGGGNITDAALTTTGAIDGNAWIDAIREANETLFNQDVPESETRWLSVPKRVFNGIKYATDANGNFLVLNRDFSGPQAGGIAGRGEILDIDGVNVISSRNMPDSDETADTSVFTKYRADFSNTSAIMWTSLAAGTIKVMDIGFENSRDTRRLEDFMVAKMLVGHGILRSECAVEFKIA